MYSLNELNETISKYYDGQMGDLELIHFEARLALSEILREYTEREMYQNFKISNSIRLAKMRLNDKVKSYKGAAE